jgi:hypothetical protein
MKYKIIILFLLSSCASSTFTSKNNFAHTSKGFAAIDILSIENSNNKYLVSHNKLKLGTKVRILNPSNKIFMETIITNKIKYDNFYKILISKNIAEKLNLDLNFPFVEVVEIKANKSFIAKKAITENIEKKIANKAPVAKISIDDLSKPKVAKKNNPKTYSILVANFSSIESARYLKKRLELILESSNYQLMYINKKNTKSYELLMGPYNSINKLKNDYIVLNDSDFEDLDIKIND